MSKGKFEIAVRFGNDFIKKYPQFTEEVKDYFQLMQDEVEQGGSVQHEMELFIGACEDLLNTEN